MRVSKPILSRDTGNWILCCWEDCEHRSVQLFMSVFHDHARGLPCNHFTAKHVRYTFCSGRHKGLFDNSHISRGNLATGSRGTIL